MASSSSLAVSFFFFFFLAFSFVAEAIVPPNKTFTFVNEGGFGDHGIENGADYRVVSVGISTPPFSLVFYNTTSNAFTLALRMGGPFSEQLKRLVWHANRGNPVRENATLTFGSEGNLVLANADGRIVWQTGTANKGVVGLKILENGNLVLHDNKGRFVWQSFDHPTDTLLVGQALRSGGPTKLVSKVSIFDDSEGLYSLVLEQKRYALYLKSKNSQKPLLYYADQESLNPLEQIVFNSLPETEEAYAYELRLEFSEINSTNGGASILGRPKYNSTFSFLRLDSDGNLKIYTYYDKVELGTWEVTFDRFNNDGNGVGCKLPKKCGSLGVCENDQCVACPRPQGLLGWSNTCAPPVLPPCKGGANVNYYKVVGVEHFMNGYTEGDGPMKVVECREKCNKDCGCLGFFYREESSKCLLAPELDTLIKVSNSSHVAFIKMSK